MKFLIIKGNVVGGHLIEDLGLKVPYQKEKRIDLDRSGWSSDLSYALNNKLVIKVGVQEPRRRPQIYQNFPEKKTKTPKTPPLKKKTPTVSLPNKLSNQDETKELRAMNKDLMEKLDQVVTKMDDIMSQSQSVMDQETLQTLLASLPQGTTVSPEVSVEDDEEDSPMYIPSTIRTDKAKTTNTLDVESTEASGGGLDSAAKALSALKKKKKGKEDS